MIALDNRSINSAFTALKLKGEKRKQCLNRKQKKKKGKKKETIWYEWTVISLNFKITITIFFGKGDHASKYLIRVHYSGEEKKDIIEQLQYMKDCAWCFHIYFLVQSLK